MGSDNLRRGQDSEARMAQLEPTQVTVTASLLIEQAESLARELPQAQRATYWRAIATRIAVHAEGSPDSIPSEPPRCQCGKLMAHVRVAGATRLIRCRHCGARGIQSGGRVVYRAKGR